MTFRVLHVCTGNICRSPMAELVMRHRLLDDPGVEAVETAGAGTWPGHTGEGINPPAGRVLAEIGIKSDRFRARGLLPEHLRDVDLVLGATGEHVRAVVRAAPELADRTYTLLGLAARARAADLPAMGRAGAAVRLRTLLESESPPRQPDPRFDLADPWGLSLETYRSTRDQVVGAVDALLGSPANDGGGRS